VVCQSPNPMEYRTLSQYQRDIERSIVTLQTALDFLQKARDYTSVNNPSMASVMAQRAKGLTQRAAEELA
jgi:hypothetical protein